MTNPSSPQHHQGLSLLEVLVFVVMLGIALSMVPLAIATADQNNRDTAPALTLINLAKSRMDLILGQVQMNGYSATLSAIDPCTATPALAVCAAPTGYNVNATLSNISGMSSQVFQQITVTASSTTGGSVSLTAVEGNY